MFFWIFTSRSKTVIILRCLWQNPRSRETPRRRVPGVSKVKDKSWFSSKSWDTYAAVWKCCVVFHWTERLQLKCMTPGIGPVGVTRDYKHHISAKKCFFEFLQTGQRPYSFSDAFDKIQTPVWHLEDACQVSHEVNAKNWFSSKSCDTYESFWRCRVVFHWTQRLQLKFWHLE